LDSTPFTEIRRITELVEKRASAIAGKSMYTLTAMKRLELQLEGKRIDQAEVKDATK
jgi:hypothetical protein